LERVYAALSRIPAFEGVPPDSVRLEPLGSMTNASYKVVLRGEAYLLRVPGPGTAEYIDRAAEEHNARAAAAAGVNAEILFFDPRDGTMLTRFIRGTPMSAERFREDPTAPARAARTLRRVHRSDELFVSAFDPFEKAADYRRILDRMRHPVPKDLGPVWRAARTVRRALRKTPLPPASCHNDPWPGNFLDAGERMYLVDWEYSGMNDSLWDLADLSAEADFDPQQDRTMMQAYFGIPSPSLYSRLELYKTVSDLLWSLWALVQHANDNPADDFLAYAAARYRRCRSRLNAPDFFRHLGTARKTPPTALTRPQRPAHSLRPATRNP
jgi:thiamine kinase-like enzyme